jgi:hypothetical protein
MFKECYHAAGKEPGINDCPTLKYTQGLQPWLKIKGKSTLSIQMTGRKV